jgi:tRNA isopentenyl-2-thiomethyl-A-37 hydroxylase MiaE
MSYSNMKEVILLRGCRCGCQCFNFRDSDEIIRFVAGQEVMLAEVLNNEAGRIRKAAATAKNVNRLLAVNDSVIETVVEIIRYEKHLLEQLRMVQNRAITGGGINGFNFRTR